MIIGLIVIVVGFVGMVFYGLCCHSGTLSDAEDCQGWCGGCRAYNVCHKDIKVVK